MADCQFCESMRLRVQELEQDYALVDKALRKERKVSHALGAQLAGKHRSAPNARDVLEVGEYWAVQLGHKRVKVVTDGKRADAIRKALSWGWTVEQLKQAVDGLARYPYVWGEPRAARRRFGLKSQRYDALERLLSAPETIERFIGYALEDEPDERLVQIRASALDAMHDRITRAEHLGRVWRERWEGEIAHANRAWLVVAWLEGEDTGSLEALYREACPAALEGWDEFKRSRPRGQLTVLPGGRVAA